MGFPLGREPFPDSPGGGLGPTHGTRASIRLRRTLDIPRERQVLSAKSKPYTASKARRPEMGFPDPWQERDTQAPILASHWTTGFVIGALLGQGPLGP